MKTALLSSTPGFCVAPKLSPSSKLKWITEEVQLFKKMYFNSIRAIYLHWIQTNHVTVDTIFTIWQCPVCILKNNILFNKVHIPLIISIIPLWIEHLSKQTPVTRKKNERPLKESSSQVANITRKSPSISKRSLKSPKTSFWVSVSLISLTSVPGQIKVHALISDVPVLYWDYTQEENIPDPHREGF